MTPWQWWAVEAEDGDVGEWNIGECDTREAIIAQANRELPAGTAFFIIEARSSEDLRHEGADIVPFLRTRNKEHLVTRASTDLLRGG